MSIYLLSLSHRTTPVEIRGQLTYSNEQTCELLKELTTRCQIDEAVILSTCNRLELYCYCKEDRNSEVIFQRMEEVLVFYSNSNKVINMKEYTRRYLDKNAVHHLFLVSAGLDSIVIGEDQILGQVKQSFDFAKEKGFTSTCFNTLFRLAITGAKRVKTDTNLSKSSVSTASLAVKAAVDEHGELKGKHVMLIGASGNIGGVLLNYLKDIDGISIYTTTRTMSTHAKQNNETWLRWIPFEERYNWLDRMDVVISATSSPHYTLTKNMLQKSMFTSKKRVLLDLAVPFDIEESAEEIQGCICYNMRHMTKLAEENNKKKQEAANSAQVIVSEYEEQFYKWFLFQSHRKDIKDLKAIVVQETCEKGAETAIDHLIFHMREVCDTKQWEILLDVIQRSNQSRILNPVREKKKQIQAYFPMFVSLSGKEFLMVGAGKIASRRAEVLAEFGANVTVVAPKGSETMERLEKDGIVKWEKRKFQFTDIDEKDIVCTATKDAKLNAEIAVMCKGRQIPVNNAGDKSQCDFYFPGIAREGNIVAGITTSGKDPTFAKELTGQLQLWLKQFN